MLRRVGAFAFILAASVTGLSAADLPQIMAGSGNTVPQCVTPGRLMAFLKQRNDELNPRYDAIATQYMRFGEAMGVRWDYAFYQMVVETGALSYWRGNRHGDVKPEQNNFAGLGATGGGERGESFKDIESGVKAHLEHILLYAGHPVANPVAERTRKVREWGILTGWQKSIRRPITYSDLATKWAPGNRAYVGMLQAVAGQFTAEVCRGPDPRPHLVQEARALIDQGAGQVAASTGTASAPSGTDAAGTAEGTPSVLKLGAELIQRVFEPKAEREQGRSALGAPPSAEPAAASVPYKVMNPPPAHSQEQPAGAPATHATAPAALTPASTAPARSASPETGPKTVAAAPSKANAGESRPAGDRPATDRPSADNKAPPEKARFALAGTAATAAAKAKPLPDTALPPAANQKCRVWTASYGGQRSIIIRSIVDQVVNFTVLDVNNGQEQREAEAFIAAYAKNGKIAGEYANQAQALDKAFELCPEG
jgi:hypothetical protein